MACKTSLFLLIKLITFTCTDLSPKKAREVTKEKKDVISNWSHLNLCSHNFLLCNTVVAVDLFVVVAVVVVAAAVVVPVVVAVSKNVQQ